MPSSSNSIQTHVEMIGWGLEEFEWADRGIAAYLGFKSLTRCIEGCLMRFAERRRMDPGGEGRVTACVPFIALLSRKSLLMERHLQGISQLRRWMGRHGGDECLRKGRQGMRWHRGIEGEGGKRTNGWRKTALVVLAEAVDLMGALVDHSGLKWNIILTQFILTKIGNW